MGFWTAFQFLTIFPAPLRRDINNKTCGESLTYFPVIGLLLGAILFGLYYGLSFIFPIPIVNALLIIALVILTGAHHLDGLADSSDGVIAGTSREERLAIMSDTRVGVFGIVSIFLLLLVKYVSLSAAPALPALLLMPALSRWTMVSAIFIFPYVKSTGMGLAFKQGATWQRFAIATAIAVIAAVALLKLWGLVLMASLWLIVFGVASCFKSRLGGLTGDTYGAINELAEVLVLLILILIMRILIMRF